ncbi:IS1 family transposase [Escherichia coli]|uniref:IS1 family transposase n=1 Tax=Escherichia coli TaxID=562 RepID=UPI000ACBF950|nr:IS1 family transposase [Escherichia coli]
MPGNSPHYGRWPQHDFTSLKKLRPQSVTSRIQPGSDIIVCAEMDEQWGYVGAKSRQRWLFYAYDSLRKTVVAHVFGERTMATLGRLMSLLSPFDVVIWMTDGWPLYESRLKGKLHVISKRYTQRIERHNLNLRQHLARLDGSRCRSQIVSCMTKSSGISEHKTLSISWSHYQGATASIFILENKYGILNLLESEQSGDFCANRGRF